MYLLKTDEKVSKYWKNLTNNGMANCCIEEMILPIYEKVMEKDWSSQDLHKFSKNMSRLQVSYVINFVSIYKMLLDMSDTTLLGVAKSLIEKEILLLDISCDSDIQIPEIIVLTAKQLISKMLKISQAPITDLEKNVHNNIKDRVESTRKRLEQLDNDNYRELFNNYFVDWVNNNILNTLLRDVVLSHQEVLYQYRKKNLCYILRTQLENYSKNMDVGLTYLIEKKNKINDFKHCEDKRRR